MKFSHSLEVAMSQLALFLPYGGEMNGPASAAMGDSKRRSDLCQQASGKAS
jgi:hypothetical protein